MTLSVGLNASDATRTARRQKNDFCPTSGMCATCLDGCLGQCEVGKSAIRSKEVIYPQPFGQITAGAQKEYPVDFSHFNIMGTAAGAYGVAMDSDLAVFPAVDLEVGIGREGDLKLRLPFVIAAMGSTNVSGNNWDHLAAGAALSGVGIAIGENVCAMDPNSEIKDGRVINSPALAKRVQDFQRWYRGKGFIAIQANVEDTRLKVQEYALEKLGVECVELKWGQGAKNIGGEVKLSTLERALQLKERGYIVLPDPTDARVQAAYKAGAFKEFERHSRIGFVDKESFLSRVAELREAGAKHVFLKTGAYRPVDLARAVKFASEAHLDLLTVDGAGGGTGMSPWRMMNEWGIPTVYIEALLYQYCERLAAKGEYVPPVAIAGGFTLEDQVFKGLALGAPFVKLVGLARSPLTAAMVGKTVGTRLLEGKVSNEYKQYGDSLEQVFVLAGEVKDMVGDDFNKLPVGAIGVYSYFERMAQGLRQFMCGARKFSLQYISRDDLVALTREAADVTGLPYIMDSDIKEVDKILG